MVKGARSHIFASSKSDIILAQKLDRPLESAQARYHPNTKKKNFFRKAYTRVACAQCKKQNHCSFERGPANEKVVSCNVYLRTCAGFFFFLVMVNLYLPEEPLPKFIILRVRRTHVYLTHTHISISTLSKHFNTKQGAHFTKETCTSSTRIHGQLTLASERGAGQPSQHSLRSPPWPPSANPRGPQSRTPRSWSPSHRR